MYGREMIKVICVVVLSPIVDFIADALMLSMATKTDDYDGIDDEIYNKDDEQVISAVIDYGDDEEVKIWGDPTFFDAARYMAGLVDNESIEKNGVVAGSHEIQDSVNDGGLRERVSTEPFYKRALNGLAKIVKARRK